MNRSSIIHIIHFDKNKHRATSESPSSNMLDFICLALLIMMLAYNFQQSQDSQGTRYDSFAPVRKSAQAVWFIDGEDYMSAVADAIESAEKEIMITDWQMNPEIFLKRPASGVDSLDWRLDKMLLRKADEGVRVYILLYWEIKRFLDLGSDHVVKMLSNHENIEVHRHPDTVTGTRNLFRWSHHEKMVIVDRSIAFVGGIDLCYGRWDTREHKLMDDYLIHPAVFGEATDLQSDDDALAARWIGKDYRNTFYNKEKKTEWDLPFVGYHGVERNEIPRMPWHDVSCAFTGEAVQDAVKHFTDRYNTLINKPWWQTYWDLSLSYVQKLVSQFLPSKKTKAEEIVSNGYNVDIQLLRSVDNWSAGQNHEASIYNAYISAIKNAKHFIYIENQFFISSQEGFFRKVQNEIQAALVERIVRAHKADEKFHVMVITPLKPEFPGSWDADDWNGDALRAVTYWNQATIYHGEDSLFGKLEKQNIPKEIAMKYFSVYSLRTYDLIGKHFMTEIVYVHSKIMIVDDRLAIIGSANINDRSMLGDRDSEVAVMIEDLEFSDGKMNGVEYKMGKFAHSLRCDLLKEHLGLVGYNDDEFEVVISDPLANNFNQGVRARAETNTVSFLIVFGPALFPKDDVKDFEAMKQHESIPLPREDTETTRGLLKNIKGNLVNYPCTFLIEKLKPSVLDAFYMYVNKKPEQPTTSYA